MSAVRKTASPAALESGNNYLRRQSLPVYIFSPRGMHIKVTKEKQSLSPEPSEPAESYILG
jgi:hypothetical protein